MRSCQTPSFQLQIMIPKTTFNKVLCPFSVSRWLILREPCWWTTACNKHHQRQSHFIQKVLQVDCWLHGKPYNWWSKKVFEYFWWQPFPVDCCILTQPKFWGILSSTRSFQLFQNIPSLLPRLRNILWGRMETTKELTIVDLWPNHGL